MEESTKKKGGSDDRQKKENKKGSTQNMDGKGHKFCDEFTNQESVLHMGSNAKVQKEESLGKLLYDKENTLSISQV